MKMQLNADCKFQERDRVRLKNDIETLLATISNSERVYCLVKKFDNELVSEIEIGFPNIRTSFIDLENGNDIIFKRVHAVCKIYPNEGEFGYPRSAPKIKFFINDIPDSLEPFLPGLLWLGPIFGGMGCLWREYTEDHDLVFIARQAFDLLTKPQYSENDSWTPPAARYYLQRPELSPFDDPIPELELSRAPFAVARKKQGLLSVREK